VTVTLSPARTEADRRAAFEVTFSAWRLRDSLPLEQARRLRAARYRSAQWWVAREEGRVLSTLVAYPLCFGGLGEGTVDGVGLGAVCTRPEARGRGLASRLCAAALDHAEGEGRSLGLLFSAIAPAIYERLGFHPVTAAARVECPLPDGFAASGPRAALTPIDPHLHLDAIAGAVNATAEAMAPGAPFLWRDADAIAWLLSVHPDELVFSVEGGGFVQLAVDQDGVELTLLAVPDRGLHLPLLRAVAALAAGLDVGLTAWLPRGATDPAWFVDRSRQHSLPMLRGVAAEQAAGGWLQVVDYF